MHTCIHACIHTCIYIYIYCITPLAWVEIQCFALTAYMPTCLPVHMRACLHAYMLTCVHAYMHLRTCLHAYMIPDFPYFLSSVSSTFRFLILDSWFLHLGFRFSRWFSIQSFYKYFRLSLRFPGAQGSPTRLPKYRIFIFSRTHGRPLFV